MRISPLIGFFESSFFLQRRIPWIPSPHFSFHILFAVTYRYAASMECSDPIERVENIQKKAFVTACIACNIFALFLCPVSVHPLNVVTHVLFTCVSSCLFSRIMRLVKERIFSSCLVKEFGKCFGV